MVGWLISVGVRLLAATWRVQRPEWPVKGPCVVALWHGQQLPMIALHRGRPFVAMISLSRDGGLLARVLGHLGYEVLRGSTSRGGREALMQSLLALREGKCPVLAVDGPRGPAGSVAPGAAALAKAAHVPVVFGRVVAAGWRARSWDRFLVPWPCARVVVEYGVWTEGEGTLEEAMAPFHEVDADGAERGT